MKVPSKKWILRLINNLLANWGIEIKRVVKNENRLLVNVFKRNHGKRVLISYITYPFTRGVNYTHTNYTECYTAAQIFDSLGYQVDVANYDDEDLEIDFKNYQVVYGQGCPLEKAFYFPETENLKKICYSTGCSLFFVYRLSGLKLFDFWSEKGKMIPQSLRVSRFFWTYQFLCPDHLIVLGNRFVTDTHLSLNPKLSYSSLDCFYHDVYDINIQNKNFGVARNHFLWFGSSGLLHKGLDLAIDAFVQLPNVHLHICGASEGERKFFEYYRPIISKAANIHEHGFVDVNSERFKHLMDSCAFAIFPSVSEGGAPALLAVMANGGLIPVCSESVGIDFMDFGIALEKNDRDSIIGAVGKVQSMTLDEIQSMSQVTKDTVRKRYSLDEYKLKLNKVINDALVA